MSRLSLKTTGIKKALLHSKIMKPVKAVKEGNPTVQKVEKPVKGSKNGGKRVVLRSIKIAETKKKNILNKPTKLRSSITPGTVLILVAGRYRGKRVVFLKQLASGYLLVTGPYKLNGVPLTRVNQVYAIATSTKVALPSLTSLDEKLNDSLFAKLERKDKKTELIPDTMEVDSKKTVTASSERVALQKQVDSALLKSIKQVPLLTSYLRSVFSLRKGQAPHLLKF